MTDPATVRNLIAAIASLKSEESLTETIFARIGDFWNTVQGVDSLTNLTSVAEGCTYNLHAFTVAARREEDTRRGRQANDAANSSKLRPGEGSTGDASSSLRPGDGSAADNSRSESDPLEVVDGPVNGPGQTDGAEGDEPSGDTPQGRRSGPPTVLEKHNLLIARVRSMVKDAEAIFELVSYLHGDVATCSVQLRRLEGFDWKLFNQLSVEFATTDVAGGTVLWMKGLFNPYGIGYAHFAAAFSITLGTRQRTVNVEASTVTLAGDLNSITGESLPSGTVVLESGVGEIN